MWQCVGLLWDGMVVDALTNTPPRVKAAHHPLQHKLSLQLSPTTMNGGEHHHSHLNPTAEEFYPSMTPRPPPQPHNIYYPFGYPPPPAYVIPASLPPPTTTPSRTLLLSMVPTTVSESAVRRDMEVFGDVRAVDMLRRQEGLVAVHFYDLRDAKAALVAVQDQHMQQQYRVGRYYEAALRHPRGLVAVAPPGPRGLVEGRVLWAQFVVVGSYANFPGGDNQGTLVVFNLDPGVSDDYVKEVFEAFGPVKELRETAKNKNQKFVEFFDVRNAAAAVAELNGKEIRGRNIVVKFSWPRRKNFLKTSLDGANSTNAPLPPLRLPSTPVLPPPTEPRLSGPPLPRKASISSRSGHDHQQEGSSSRTNTNSFKKDNSKLPCDGRSSARRPCKASGGGGGRYGEDCYDPRYLIKEDAVMDSNCRDPRTTIMIKNIPNKYSQKLLLNLIDNHCISCNDQIAASDSDDQQPLSAYDFVYLPIDFINKCNVGYGFVNMTSPEAAIRLYKAFHGRSWEAFKTRKICEVTYARIQGLEALMEHFKSSKYPGDMEEYMMPVVFSPPRDGRTLTDPAPVVGRGVGSPEAQGEVADCLKDEVNSELT